MALNANYILAGQQVDPVGAIGRGAQVGQQVNEFRNTNALRQMYRERGADILRGDENALAALAQFSPQEALGVQTARLGQDRTRLDMQATQQRMDMLSREEQRQVEAHAASISAEQRAAEIAAIESKLRGASFFHSQGDEQGYNDYLVQNGLDPQSPEYSFNNFPATAARYESVLDTLKRFDEMNAVPEAPTPQTQIAKLQADLANGLITQDQYELGIQGMAPSGMSLRTTPDGGIELIQGPGAGGAGSADMTVDEAKNAGFLERLQSTAPILDQLEEQGLSVGQQALGAVPFGLGNFARTPEFQQYDQAKRDFVNAILRRESGAVISAEEFANAEQQYFPVPGDSPQVVAQKRQNRAAAVRGVALGAGPGAALTSGNIAPQSGPAPVPAVGEVVDGFRFRGGDPARQENWEPI